MSKIEELKKTLIARQEYLRTAVSVVEGTRELIEEVKQEIKDLEAEASKPREWEMFLLDDGTLATSYLAARADYGWRIKPRITVIEKKPVRVTKAMAAKMHKSWCESPGRTFEPVTWVAALQAIGIDAVAADE